MDLQLLHLAVEARSIKTVELLLASSHVANTIGDFDGCLPLHIAVRRGSHHPTFTRIRNGRQSVKVPLVIRATPLRRASSKTFSTLLPHSRSRSLVHPVNNHHLLITS